MGLEAPPASHRTSPNPDPNPHPHPHPHHNRNPNPNPNPNQAREQQLFNSFFRGALKLLPKRYNAEHRMWDTAHAPWLSIQNESLGAQVSRGIPRALIVSIDTVLSALVTTAIFEREP